MKTKKKFALSMAAVMALVLVSGCSQKSTSAQESQSAAPSEVTKSKNF